MRKPRKPRPPNLPPELRRGVKFQMRLTTDEYRALTSYASKAGQTIAAYLREKALS